MNLVSDHFQVSADVLSEIIGSKVTSIERAGRSGNSKVFRVQCESGDDYAVKFYFQRTVAGLDRMHVESSALSFMWAAGIRSVPRLLRTDDQHQLAVFEFIHGTDIDSSAVSIADVHQAMAFAASLKRASLAPAAISLPAASEAAFSIEGVAATIQRRLDRLMSLQNVGASSEALSCFLRSEFAPAFSAVKEWAQGRTAESYSSELPTHRRTISPSDFGFHNALRRTNGELVFLDFEYFGWDDPVKLIADFILHPAMNLTDDVKRLFVEGMLECFSDDETIERRFQTLRRFIALKWCMIMLNEFIPSNLERRRFAGAALDDESLRVAQLEKSRAMLRTAIRGLDQGGFSHA